MTAFFGVQAKRVGESPILHMLQGRSFRLATEDAVLPQTRVVHVAIFGSDIKITTEQHRSIGVVNLVEKSAQLFHPFQLELIFFRTDRLPVGNVDVYDAHTGDVCREQTRLAGWIVSGIAALDAGAAGFGNNRDTVVTLLAKHYTVISQRLYFERWKFIVRAFGFLDAKNVGLLRLEPARDVRQPRQNRVHIPGSNFHFVYPTISMGMRNRASPTYCEVSTGSGSDRVSRSGGQ